MKICTFFGHRYIPERIKPAIKKVIIEMITVESVGCFYVGHNGQFDHMVIRPLEELKKTYDFQYAIILEKIGQDVGAEWDKTLFPQGLERVPPRYAIWHRNKWMVEQADYVIAYLVHPSGGAGQFIELAKKKKKKIIYI